MSPFRLNHECVSISIGVAEQGTYDDDADLT
jgi:hypothetical protein